MQIVKYIAYLLLIFLVSCNRRLKQSEDIASYLVNNYDYVHSIHGFYIVGAADSTKSVDGSDIVSGEAIFAETVSLFSNFLDQDCDGKLDSNLCLLSKGLADYMLFAIGPQKWGYKVIRDIRHCNKQLYVMNMHTDEWPYYKSYDGKDWSTDKLTSSMWRPERSSALWEEVFHTITEAYNRVDSEFSFREGILLKYMEMDISAGTYDISEQNRLEGGQYDKETAVNEYIHQIWAIYFSGHEGKLNNYQKKVLSFMKKKRIPMRLEENYEKILGKRLK